MAVPFRKFRILSTEEWIAYRAEITRLYVDKNRTLKQVMDYMESHHVFRATVKMYKNRIKAWGLDKKNKRAEIEAILHKKAAREAVGKSSLFKIRGRPVDFEDVQRYAQRHRITDVEIQALVLKSPKTPPDLSCCTPPSLPGLIDALLVLRIPELILQNTATYIKGSIEMNISNSESNASFTGKTWLDSDEPDLTIEPASLFADSVFLACELLHDGRSVEGGLQLVTACSHIEQVVTSSSVYVVNELLMLYRWLFFKGHTKLSSVIFEQVQKMSCLKLMNGDPRKRIFAHITDIDALNVSDLKRSQLECSVDLFNDVLGEFHATSLLFQCNALTNPEMGRDSGTVTQQLQVLSEKVDERFGKQSYRALLLIYYRLVHETDCGRFDNAERFGTEFRRRMLPAHSYGVALPENLVLLLYRCLQCLCVALWEQGNVIQALQTATARVGLCYRNDVLGQSRFVESLLWLEECHRQAGNFSEAGTAKARRLDIMNSYRSLV